jgi:5-methylcytosine-specific restriction endonuclease McrA
MGASTATQPADSQRLAQGGDDPIPGPAGPAAPPGDLKGQESEDRRDRQSGSSRVLVLNASYEPLNVCTVRRAVVLVLKEKAELIETGSRRLRSESLTLPHPVVIRLVSYVRVPRDTSRRKITRRAVFARDSWTCQYCGTTSHLTVDHVVPRSRGGMSVWENIVTSCAPCNRRKGNRTPVEVDMHPRHKPRAPGPTVFIRLAAPVVPTAWQQYLLPA